MNASTHPYTALVHGVGRSSHRTLAAAQRAAKRAAGKAAKSCGGPAPMWKILPTAGVESVEGCIIWLAIRDIVAVDNGDGRVRITDSGAYDPIPTPKGWSHDGADDSGEYIAR